jgi:cystathionine beta-lyase/cystathionine gamma-synthase
MKIDTQLVQTGVRSDKITGSVSTPIYQVATFQHPGLGESTGFDYSRTINPTRKVLEEAISKLEGGTRGFAFASGMAAIATVLALLKAGDRVLISDDLYGGTYRLFNQVFSRFGLIADYVDMSNLSAVPLGITRATKAIFIETPTNPLMKISDIRALSDLAKRHSLLTIVDNTFMTPYLQNPLHLGADIVIHSATKFLGGHNDLLAGLVVVNDEALGERLHFLQNSIGAVLGPWDCWLLMRGLKTLALRLEKQQQNAARIASWLSDQSYVQRVYFPGLSSHPGNAVNRAQARGPGAMISFEVDSFERVKNMLRRVKIILFAESLGGVETLVTFPATQTHSDIPEEVRLRLGITDRLLRLSVGIEDADDLIADLEQALAA